MNPSQRILIAGAFGMVGSALVRRLQQEGFSHLLTPSRKEVDFLDQKRVYDYLQSVKPDVVVIAAAKVGGIHANQQFPADFLYENLMIACHLIHGAFLAGVGRLLFLGSSCIYPRLALQPIVEEALLTGPLEPTNEGYALAKIAGVKLCQFYSQQYGKAYISAMPTNLYGPRDNYHPMHSHVIPGLMRRFHEAKMEDKPTVEIWGSGLALREFLHVDDLAVACLHLLKCYKEPFPINVGSSDEVTIRQLAEMIAEVVGYRGTLIHDKTKPDGTPRKKTDTSKLTALGWTPQISLEEGLKMTYSCYAAVDRVCVTSIHK